MMQEAEILILQTSDPQREKGRLSRPEGKQQNHSILDPDWIT